MYVMYCVTSREVLKLVNGNRGKMMAQAGHAFLHSAWDAADNFPDDLAAYKASGSAKKITLVVDTIDELKTLYGAYKGVCGTTLVVDKGLTCFDGPTTTCLGIGPISEDKVDVNLSSLKVLL